MIFIFIGMSGIAQVQILFVFFSNKFDLVNVLIFTLYLLERRHLILTCCFKKNTDSMIGQCLSQNSGVLSIKIVYRK